MRRVVLLLALAACSKKAALAELTKADGPVDRQAGAGAWSSAPVGTKYYLGDAARTADGAAQLSVTGGAATLAMEPRTILRFGGTKDASQLLVELGAVSLTGSGSYGLDVGDVKLTGGTVRITAKAGGGSTLTLEMGDAVLTTRTGQTFDLDVGGTLELGDVIVRATPDAAPPVDAQVAEVDAAPPVDAPEVTGGATIEVTGKKVEVLAPGDTKWKALAAGAGALAQGAKVRVGAGSGATIVANGTTLELGGGARMALTEQGTLFLELGDARAAVPAATTGSIGVPGGEVALEGTATSGAEARIALGARGAKVTVTRGGAKLVGSSGGVLAMNRGESATLAKAGTIRVVEAIPSYFDFPVSVGGSVVIHDPKGATAVQFAFDGKCPDGGFIEMDKSSQFRTAKVSSGKDTANMMVPSGTWLYRLRCNKGGGDSGSVGGGRVRVMRDSGSRPLPKKPATNTIPVTGQTITIGYQSELPSIAIPTKGDGVYKLHVATGGAEKVYTGSGKIVIPSKDLAEENTYTFWLEKNGVKDPKVSGFKFEFDNTTPQVYIQAPVNGVAWGDQILVRGSVLTGWSAAINGTPIPMDAQRRFKITVDKPTAAKALAIKLSHPQRGVHYYLRRGAK